MKYLSTFSTAQLFDLFCKNDIDCKPIALKEMRERWVQSDDVNKDTKYCQFLCGCFAHLALTININGVDFFELKSLESWLGEKGYFLTEDEKFRVDQYI